MGCLDKLGSFLLCVFAVAIALFLIAAAFTIHPILGLAVLITTIICIVALFQRAKANDTRNAEEKAEIARQMEVERQKALELRQNMEEQSRQNLERQAREQELEQQKREAHIKQQNEIDPFSDQDRHPVSLPPIREAVADLFASGAVKTMRQMSNKPIRCAEGHEYLNKDSGVIGCQSCAECRTLFINDDDKRYWRCTNTVPGDEGQYFHWFRDDSKECPLCARLPGLGQKVYPFALTMDASNQEKQKEMSGNKVTPNAVNRTRNHSRKAR